MIQYSAAFTVLNQIVSNSIMLCFLATSSKGAEVHHFQRRIIRYPFSSAVQPWHQGSFWNLQAAPRLRFKPFLYQQPTEGGDD